MRPFSLTASLLLALLSAEPALAAGKPKGCFAQAEHQAEWEVRHGVRLREAADRCGVVYQPGMPKTWEGVADKLGARFKTANDTRRKAFQREFPDNFENAIVWWDGKIVMYFRNYPVNAAWCGELAKQLDEVSKKGYKAFQSQAKLGRGEVQHNIKACF